MANADYDGERTMRPIEDKKPLQTRPLDVPLAGLPLSQCPTNIDMTTRKGRGMAFAASSPGNIIFGPDGTAKIRATHYLIFPDRGADPETGEVKDFARVVLYDRDGKTYRTTAAHAPKKLRDLLDLFTPEEWAEGIPLVISERVSPRTRQTYHDMRLEIE